MNIFLSKNDEVKVGDLGVAKVLGNTMDMAHTMVCVCGMCVRVLAVCVGGVCV